MSGTVKAANVCCAASAEPGPPGAGCAGAAPALARARPVDSAAAARSGGQSGGDLPSGRAVSVSYVTTRQSGSDGKVMWTRLSMDTDGTRTEGCRYPADEGRVTVGRERGFVSVSRNSGIYMFCGCLVSYARSKYRFV